MASSPNPIQEPFFEHLAAHHDRSSFDCGEPTLNEYLQKYARQNASRNLGITHIAVSTPGDSCILGYYTLLTRVLDREALPGPRQFPPDGVGAVLPGRLAVDQSAQGRGLGTTMLLRAVRQTEAAAHNIGIHALFVHALNERARDWYLSFGFETLLDDPLHLYMPIDTIRALGLTEE